MRERRRRGLLHHVHRAEDGLRRIAARARPLDEERLDRLAHEDPLHARGVVLDERLHEQPLALDVEPEELLLLLVEREAVGGDGEEARALDRRAGRRREIEEEIDVAPRAMRRVPRDAPAAGRREIADHERRAGALGVDARSGALERLDEARYGVVPPVFAQPVEAGPLPRQLGARREDAAVRHPDRPREMRGERRRRTRAAERDQRKRSRRDEEDAAHDRRSRHVGLCPPAAACNMPARFALWANRSLRSRICALLRGEIARLDPPSALPLEPGIENDPRPGLHPESRIQKRGAKVVEA